MAVRGGLSRAIGSLPALQARRGRRAEWNRGRHFPVPAGRGLPEDARGQQRPSLDSRGAGSGSTPRRSGDLRSRLEAFGSLLGELEFGGKRQETAAGANVSTSGPKLERPAWPLARQKSGHILEAPLPGHRPLLMQGHGGAPGPRGPAAWVLSRLSTSSQGGCPLSSALCALENPGHCQLPMTFSSFFFGRGVRRKKKFSALFPKLIFEEALFRNVHFTRVMSNYCSVPACRSPTRDHRFLTPRLGHCQPSRRVWGQWNLFSQAQMPPQRADLGPPQSVSQEPLG
jgi:hypothetical protein